MLDPSHNPSVRELLRLHDPGRRPFSDIKDVAIAIGKAGQEQQHVGILYSVKGPAGQVVSLLHLAWHHDLRSEDVARSRIKYFWVQPAVNSVKLSVVNGLCRMLADKYQRTRGRGVAYALRYTDGRFDGSLRFVTADGHGLTCATFVMALFKTRGISLLRQDEWPQRQQDRQWQKHIVDMLEKMPNGDTDIQVHIKTVEKEVGEGCARFRPEEVAASGLAEKLPVSFEFAERMGRRIVEQLEAR